jgi:predicted nucleic acid-binding protein
MKVVLDTNVLVSGLMYPKSAPGRIVSAWREKGASI